MSYLSRLAAQSGLTNAPPQPSEPTAGIEVIEEQAETIPAPDLLPASAPIAPPPRLRPPTPDQDRIIEQIVLHSPAPAAPETRPPAPRAADAPPAPPANHDISSAATPDRAAPQDAATPTDQLRDLRIRQMLEWVAQNEPPRMAPTRPNPPDATLVKGDPLPPEPMPETARPIPAALEIAAPRPPAPPPAPTHIPPVSNAAPPAQAPARDMPPAPQTRIVEERIDISIGTIRLDVRPPAGTAMTPRPATSPPPAPAPRPAGAPDASRLRRRYLRW